MMPSPRSLLMVGCLLALLLCAPALRATDVLVGNGTGGTTAHGNDGVGGIERAKRFLPKPPTSNGNGSMSVPGGASLLLPPPPPSATNDLSQTPEGDLGGRLAGTTPEPRLAVAADRRTLEVRGGLAGADALVVIGAGLSGAAFKGGSLVPRPDVLLTGLVLDDQGGLDLPLAQLPSGMQLAVQVWFADDGAPAGLAATNGLALVGED